MRFSIGSDEAANSEDGIMRADGRNLKPNEGPQAGDSSPQKFKLKRLQDLSNAVSKVVVDPNSGSEKKATSMSLTRKFNCPTGLDDQTVWLALLIGLSTKLAAIELNGVALGFELSENREIRLVVSSLLKPHNELKLTIEHADKLSEELPVSRVRLEIVDEAIAE